MLTRGEKQELRYREASKLMQECPQYPKSIIKATFGFSDQGYYNAGKAITSESRAEVKQDKDEIVRLIKEIFKASNGQAGIGTITQKLRNYGVYLSIPTVRKYARANNLYPVNAIRHGKYSSYQHGLGNVASNHLKRDFSSNKCLEKISTDVSEFKVCGKTFYLSIFVDAFNNEIVAFSISDSPTVQFVIDGFKKLVAIIPRGQTCWIHSDQGHQYKHALYMRFFKENPNLIRSMSRKGNCLDNYLAEQIFGKIKTEFFYKNKFNSVDEAKRGLIEYIYYYNHERIQESLGWKSPVTFRLEHAEQALELSA